VQDDETERPGGTSASRHAHVEWKLSSFHFPFLLPKQLTIERKGHRGTRKMHRVLAHGTDARRVLRRGKKTEGAAEKKNETKAAAMLDEKNKKQKKRNTSNQQLSNEQACKLNKASYWMKVQATTGCWDKDLTWNNFFVWFLWTIENKNTR
jgi:selenocysteine-specific translation elongation factor